MGSVRAGRLAEASEAAYLARAASLEGGSAGASKTDAEYFEAIRSGPGIMPSFRNLTDAQIGAVIVYLRRLQGR